MSFYGNVVINDPKKFESNYKIDLNKSTSNTTTDRYELSQGGVLIGVMEVPTEEFLNSSFNVFIDDSNKSNGEYIFKQNNKTIGAINIPKDIVLNSVELKTFSLTDNLPQGLEVGVPYMVFKFNTENQDPLYLDVRALNEIAGSDTDTIHVEVDSNQQITANVKINSITAHELKDNTITGGKIAKKAITSDLLADDVIAKINADMNTITTLAQGVNIEITDNGINGNHAYSINGKDWANDIAKIEVFNTDILTVNALGGIKAGEDLDGLTTRQILNKLLFPYVAQVVDTPSRIPSNTVLEKGNNQKITSVTVKVTKKSEIITSVALYNGSTKLAEKTGSEVAAGGTFTFSGLNVAVPSTNVVLTVKVTDASGNVVSKNTAGWTFVYPYYYGVCADGAIINEALVEGLTKKIETKGNKTDWSFTCNNQCIVFAYPKTYGVLNKIIDPNNFDITGSFARHEVSITGLDGTTQAYYVYVNGASTVTAFKVDFNY